MPDSTRTFLLGELLKGVSRSFYLTLRILPAGMRDPVSLAYLLARAADTIADTALISPAQRLELLLSLRARINGTHDEAALTRIATEVATRQGQADEKRLLESLGPSLALLEQLEPADREAVRDIVSTLTQGMEFDLRTFPDENAKSTEGAENTARIVAIDDAQTLDRYTYLVAGCVGDFWTRMTHAHVPGALKDALEPMSARGIRFGKALQLTNILRDAGKDLRIGRCYLPAPMLERAGLTARDLLETNASARARPLRIELVRAALAHYRAALDYSFALARTSLRLRLACLWPIFIGLETLLLLAHNDAWLDPARASKIRRGDVYRIIACSVPLAASNTALRLWADGLMRKIEAGLAG